MTVVAVVMAVAAIIWPRLAASSADDSQPADSPPVLIGADGEPLDIRSADDLDQVGIDSIDLSDSSGDVVVENTGAPAPVETEQDQTEPNTQPLNSTALCQDREVTDDALNEAFGGSVDAIVGADYQRAFELDDGRVLWVFQDAFVDDGQGDPTFAHNAGAMQEGMCFESLVGGTESRPEAWVAADQTQPFQNWYWPLDGYQATDDTFVLFLAEMVENGSQYLDNATPIATWSVEIDLDTLEPGALVRAPNPNDELYGFEITTDDEYLYLYAQCHRQFGFSYLGHDECAADVFVARQPLDQLNLPLEYWTGDGWSRNSRSAVNVAPLTGPGGEARTINPMQIERDGDRWIAVTKVGDWWGDSVYFDVADTPVGPWTTTAVFPVATQGDPDDFASYFVSFVPSDDSGHTIAVSNNRWDGDFSDIYHPAFTTMQDWVWGSADLVEVSDGVWLPLGA